MEIICVFSSDPRDGFLMLLIPIMKTLSMHSLRVFVRQHDQNLDDEPIVFNFNVPDDFSLDTLNEAKSSSQDSDPFTGMESSVFDLRIKRDTSSCPKQIASSGGSNNNSGIGSGIAAERDSNGSGKSSAVSSSSTGEIGREYDFVNDFETDGINYI